MLVTGTRALADEPDPAATALFREGRALVTKGDWQAGCEKLAQSFSRQPSASTLLNIARCDEHDGKIATAWARHQQALPLLDRVVDPVRREELLGIAREGIARLEPQLPKLHVIVTPEDAKLTDEAGRAIPSGTPVPLDPGPHTVTARADGKPSSTYRVELAPGRTTQLVVHLERPPAAFMDGSTTPAGDAEQRFPWLACGVGTLGVALGAVAVGFGVDAANATSRLHTRCGADLVCNEDPSFDPGPLNDRKNTSLGLAIGFGAASAVALGVATWLFARSRPTVPPASVWLSPRPIVF